MLTDDCTIHYGRLWDGISDTLAGPGKLCISGGHIGGPPALLPQQEIDLSLFTLLPALIDCHLHLALPSAETSQLHKRAAGLLASGVAAVRDAGSPFFPLPSLPPLCVAATGTGIGRAGNYGGQIGKLTASKKEAEGLVDSLAACGVRQIKVIASGIFSFSSYGEVGPPSFSEEELSSIVRRAQHHGLPVMAHASGDEAVRRCIKAKVHSIEHGYFITENTLHLLAESGIFWVPTLCPVSAFLEDHSLLCGQASIAVIRRSLHRQMKLVSLGAQLGVTIGAGTDAGAPGVTHGPSLHRELSLLIECGLSVPQALRAATSSAARICGLERDMGAVLPGRKPYLLAVRGNPLESLSLLPGIEHILLPS
ncbi:MAG: amidohydrolase family protein [Dethiobacter sp.]|jgi:imidazolonepropionase-like amidohydrolase|nr:amidohydrolase family protein [Dethiobacter sp.]